MTPGAATWIAAAEFYDGSVEDGVDADRPLAA